MIESENLYFRPITAEDTEMVLGWRNSAAVKSSFLYREDITVEEHMNWLETRVKTGRVLQFIIVVKKTDKPIGSVYFRDIDRIAMKGEYGIFIGEEDEKGKGYGSETAARMVTYFLKELGFHKLSLRVLEWNKAAIIGYENAGFKVEGKMIDEIYVDGKYENVIFMAVINREDSDR
jgi:UDP-4-amino-4,6-dideoxy-N-acetyl-beta-L-altrosamine N-acetyltransferase